MNKVALDRSGVLYWNGKRVSSDQLDQLLRASHNMDPEPEVFLETEMGAPCEALDAVQLKSDTG